MRQSNNERKKIKGKFIQIPICVLQCNELILNSKLVLSLISSYEMDNKTYYGGQQSLAHTLCLSLDQTKRALRQLKDLGYIKISQQERKDKTSIISLTDKSNEMFFVGYSDMSKKKKEEIIDLRDSNTSTKVDVQTKVDIASETKKPAKNSISDHVKQSTKKEEGKNKKEDDLPFTDQVSNENESIKLNQEKEMDLSKATKEERKKYAEELSVYLVNKLTSNIKLTRNFKNSLYLSLLYSMKKCLIKVIDQKEVGLDYLQKAMISIYKPGIETGVEIAEGTDITMSEVRSALTRYGISEQMIYGYKIDDDPNKRSEQLRQYIIGLKRDLDLINKSVSDQISELSDIYSDL